MALPRRDGVVQWAEEEPAGPPRRAVGLAVGPDYDEAIRSKYFAVRSAGPLAEEPVTRTSTAFIASAPSLERPPFKAGWLEIDVDPGAPAREPIWVSASAAEGPEGDPDGEWIWGPRGSPGRRDDPTGNLNRAMVYYPSNFRGPATTIIEGRFPLIGFAHGHDLPYERRRHLAAGRRGDVDANAEEISEDYRQWSGMLRYLASWGSSWSHPTCTGFSTSRARATAMATRLTGATRSGLR